MEAILNDKEFLEILIKKFPEDEKTHLKQEYDKLTNKHQKVDFLYTISEFIDYDYKSCMEILKRNFFA